MLGTATTAVAIAKVIPFYLGGICWTVVYDTIYAYNDRNDDVKQNLKGLAVLWGPKTKENCLFYNNVQFGLFACSGIVLGMNPLFYLGMGAVWFELRKRISHLNLEDSESCQEYF